MSGGYGGGGGSAPWARAWNPSGAPLNRLAGGGYTFPNLDQGDGITVKTYAAAGGTLGTVNAAASVVVVAQAGTYRIAVSGAANAQAGHFPASAPAVILGAETIAAGIGAWALGVPTYWDPIGAHNLINEAMSGSVELELPAGAIVTLDTAINAGFVDQFGGAIPAGFSVAKV